MGEHCCEKHKHRETKEYKDLRSEERRVGKEC